MLYNKNQFRKTNDKKVLHKIGKHWVTVSVAFLSLLGLGAVSTTATTHADTTANANAQTTSAAPNSNSADSIQKQVTKQANALHNQLLGHAAVSQKSAQQGTARLGSVNGRVNHAQTQNAQQNNKPANNQMSANHSNVMRLGSTNSLPALPANETYVSTNNYYHGLTYNLIADSNPSHTMTNYDYNKSDQVSDMQLEPATYEEWKKPRAVSSEDYSNRSPYDYLKPHSDGMGDTEGLSQTDYRVFWKSLNSGSNNQHLIQSYDNQVNQHWLDIINGKYTISIPYNYKPKHSKVVKHYVAHPLLKTLQNYPIIHHNYRVEFTGGKALLNHGRRKSRAKLSDLLPNLNTKLNPNSYTGGNIVSVKFDPGVDTTGIKDMKSLLGEDSDLTSVEGLNNLNTSDVRDMSYIFSGDVKLNKISGISNWNTSNATDMDNMFSGDKNLISISDMTNWDTENVKNIEAMFSDDTHLYGSTVNQMLGWRFKNFLGDLYGDTYNIKHAYSDQVGNIFYNTPLNNPHYIYGYDPRLINTTKANNNVPLYDKRGNRVYKLDLAPFNIDNAPIATTYDGLHFNYDKQTGTIEFTGGTYTPSKSASATYDPYFNVKPNNTFSSLAPDVIKNAYNIKFDKGVNFNGQSDLSGLLSGMPNLLTVNMQNVKASDGKIKNMSFMFATDPSLQSVVFPSDLNVTNTSDMSFMFSNDYLLNYINFGHGFSNNSGSTGTNMNAMFYETPALHHQSNIKGFSDFDTSRATSMDWMFSRNGLYSLNLPKSFKTNNVTSMNGMFSFNNHYTEVTNLPAGQKTDGGLNLGPNFNTSNVTSMMDMFWGNKISKANPTNYSNVHLINLARNKNLKPSDIYDFDTSKVTNMSYMFADNVTLRNLILPSSTFDTSKVTNMSHMFLSDDKNDGNDQNKNDPNAGADVRNALNNSLTLVLPPKFIINPRTMNTSDMYENAALNSISIENPNTRFSNSYTKIIPLYQQLTPTGEFGTNLGAKRTMPRQDPHDFMTAPEGVIFTPCNNVPKELAFSDIFSDTDGALDWRLPKTPQPWTNLYSNNGSSSINLNGWTFVDSDGAPVTNSNEAAMKNGRILVAPVFRGYMFRYHPSDNSIEFIDGPVNSNDPHKYNTTDLSYFDEPSNPNNPNNTNNQTEAQDDTNGEVTIDHAVENASTLNFDAPQQLANSADYLSNNFSDVSDMKYMFANPNLKHINFDYKVPNTSEPDTGEPTFDTSKVTNMEGMFQGANVSDLTLPDGFTTKHVQNMSDMFAGSNNDPSTALKTLTVTSPNTHFDYNDYTKMPTLYREVNGKDSHGHAYTDINPTEFGKLDNSDAVGTYINPSNDVVVTGTVQFNVKNKNGQLVSLGTLPIKQAGDSTFTVYNHGVKGSKRGQKVPAGYKLDNNQKTYSIQLGDTNATNPYQVTVVPVRKSANVEFVYTPKNGTPKTVLSDSSNNEDLISNPFTGNDYADKDNVNDTSVELTKDSPTISKGGTVPDGWIVESPVTIKFDGKTYQVNVLPKQAEQTFYYKDENPSDGSAYNQIVGSSEVSGNSNAAAPQASDTSIDITKSNDSGLSAGYHLDDTDNEVDFTNVTGNGGYYIPVSKDNGHETINYQYDGVPVSASTATFKGAPAGKFNVTGNVPKGYHLVSGTSSAFAYDNYPHDVDITQNTITENVNYAVQNSAAYHAAGSTASGFSSVINDARTNYGNTSFDVNSHNASNLPDGYHLVSANTKIGPTTTDLTSSSADNTIEIAPDMEKITVQYKNSSDGSVLGQPATYSGYVDNNFSSKVVVPEGYNNPVIYNATTDKPMTSLSTSFAPEVTSDLIDITVQPNQETSHIQYVDASQNNKAIGGLIAVSGDSVNVPNANNTGENITSSNAPQLPKGYVLVNGNNQVSYDGKTYNIPLVPASNNLMITYQYNNVPIATHVFHGGSWNAELDINKSNDAGLPDGYQLVDENNAYGNKFHYSQKSANVAIEPVHQSDTINYTYNGKTVSTGNASGNDYRATAAGDNNVTIQYGNTPGLSQNYYVPNAITINYDGRTHNVPVLSSKDVDTVNYMYNGQNKGSYQFLGDQNRTIDITTSNQPDMPAGYHLVNNNNSFTANNGDHSVQVAPDTMTFTVNFMNGNKNVGQKTYSGDTDTPFTVNGATDAPSGYTVNGNQTMNYTFNGNPSDNDASLQVTPIAPQDATETINFLYTNKAAGQVYNEGDTRKSGVKGSQGTVAASDYNNIKPGYQVVPNENTYNKGSKYTFDNGSVDIYVEPIQQTEKVWYVNDQTGRVIGNDGPFADTIKVTGNDSRATDAGNNSFVIGSDPTDLDMDYYRVDNPHQVIPYNGLKQVVNVHLIKQAPYSAEASQAAAAKQAAANASISAAASSMAKEQNSKAASSYASSAEKSAASATSSEATNSVASTNDSSEYSHESSSNSSIASSASSSASASESSANSSSNSSIASTVTSHSTSSVAPSSSAIPKSSSASSIAPSSSASVMPYIPFVPSSAPSSVSSSASSVASRVTKPASKSAAPVNRTNKHYPIIYAKSANKPDMVTYMGRQYPVHYHANGKNTVYARIRYVKNGRVHYRNRTVVVSTNLPTIKPSSDSVVRAVDRIDFNKVNKRVWTAKGLNKALSKAKPGEVISYHGQRMAVINDPIHWRYFMVTREALAHDFIFDVGRTMKVNPKKLLKTHHALTVFINRIVAYHTKSANFIRYEFKFNGHMFWVTGRNDYVPNAYWQKHEFQTRRAHYVRVVRPCRIYRSSKYNQKTFVKNVRRGVVLHVAKVINLGPSSYEQTRLILTNGHYVTANKNFVKIIK